MSPNEPRPRERPKPRTASTPPAPPRQLADLLRALAATEAELAAWQVEINRAFAARFDPRKAFNEQPSAEFGPSLLAAGAGARNEVGTEPETRAFALLDVLCDWFLAASDVDRAAMIDAVSASRAVVGRLTWYLARCRRLLEAERDVRWLRLALAAVSLSDLRTDYRDVYMSLGQLYQAALRAGIEPGDAFREIGGLSNDQPRMPRGTGTRRFLGEFERSAYFRSIRRELEAARAEGRRRLPPEKRRVSPPGPA